RAALYFRRYEAGVSIRAGGRLDHLPAPCCPRKEMDGGEPRLAGSTELDSGICRYRSVRRPWIHDRTVGVPAKSAGGSRGVRSLRYALEKAIERRMEGRTRYRNRPRSGREIRQGRIRAAAAWGCKEKVTKRARQGPDRARGRRSESVGFTREVSCR